MSTEIIDTTEEPRDDQETVDEVPEVEVNPADEAPEAEVNTTDEGSAEVHFLEIHLRMTE